MGLVKRSISIILSDEDVAKGSLKYPHALLLSLELVHDNYTSRLKVPNLDIIASLENH